MRAKSLATLIGSDVDSFEINHLRSLSHDVSLELQLVVLGDDPNPALFNSPGASFAKPVRIFFQRIYPAFFKSQLRVHRNHQIEISEGGHTQAANVFR